MLNSLYREVPNSSRKDEQATSRHRRTSTHPRSRVLLVLSSHLQRPRNSSFSISSTDFIHKASSESFRRRKAVGGEHDSAEGRRRKALLKDGSHTDRERCPEIIFIQST